MEIGTLEEYLFGKSETWSIILVRRCRSWQIEAKEKEKGRNLVMMREDVITIQICYTHTHTYTATREM